MKCLENINAFETFIEIQITICFYKSSNKVCFVEPQDIFSFNYDVGFPKALLVLMKEE